MQRNMLFLIFHVKVCYWIIVGYTVYYRIFKLLNKIADIHISEIDGTQRLTPFVCISNKLLTEIDFQRLFSINLD